MKPAVGASGEKRLVVDDGPQDSSGQMCLHCHTANQCCPETNTIMMRNRRWRSFRRANWHWCGRRRRRRRRIEVQVCVGEAKRAFFLGGGEKRINPLNFCTFHFQPHPPSCPSWPRPRSLSCLAESCLQCQSSRCPHWQELDAIGIPPLRIIPLLKAYPVRLQHMHLSE